MTNEKRPGRHVDAFTRKKHDVTCRCGVTFETTGARTFLCADCRRIWDKIWNRMAYKAKRDGTPYKALRDQVLAEFDKRIKDTQTKRQVVREKKQCPYCGRVHTAKSAYCPYCTKWGFDKVHEETGKTNGWDEKKKNHVLIVSGWRGRPCAGGGAACSVAKLTASLAVDYVRCK